MNNWQLIIITGLVIVLITLCIWYLIENRGSEKIIDFSFKSLLIPVVIAFGLFLFELVKPLNIKKDKMVFSITENPYNLKRLVTHHEGSAEPINRGIMETTVFFEQNKQSLPLTSDKNKIEVAEIILLHLINKRYSEHWQVEYKQNESFFDIVSSVTSQKIDADSDKIIMDENALHLIYPKDHLIQKINSQIKFVIPKKTRFSVSGNDHKRVIKIENKYISTNLSIVKVGTGTLPYNGGKTASLIRKKLNLSIEESYRLDFYGYVLKMETLPKRIRKWNPSTIEQTEWISDLFEYLRMSYGWESILKQLEGNNQP